MNNKCVLSMVNESNRREWYVISYLLYKVQKHSNCFEKFLKNCKVMNILFGYMKEAKCRKGSAQQEKQVCPVQHDMLPTFDKWARSCSVLMPFHFYKCKSTVITVLCRRNCLWQIQNYFNTNIVYCPLLCWLTHKPNSSPQQCLLSLLRIQV